MPIRRTRFSFFAAVVTLAIGLTSTLVAQSKSVATPKWAAVSIRPCDSKTHERSTVSPGRLTLSCTDLRNLINLAYSSLANGHFDARWSVPIEGGPVWLAGDPSGSRDRYTINAKAEGNPNAVTMMAGPMMQAVLQDRFKLKLHWATREAPVYALTVARGGFKLQHYREGGCSAIEDGRDRSVPITVPPCRMLKPTKDGLDVYGATMKELGALFRPSLDRPVIDRTGIVGMYNSHLDLSLADLGVPSEAAPGLPKGRTTLTEPADRFDAVRTAFRKLGLSLEPSKGPQDILIVDHVERPSEN